MHIDEIGSYGINYVRNRVWFLIKKCGFPRQRFEDLQQELLVDLIRRLPRHDPARSPRNAFITRVVKNKVFDILTERDAPSREHIRNEVSIDKPLRQDGSPAKLCDMLCGARSGSDSSDLAMDLEHALAALPRDLRALWDLILQGFTPKEISSRTGIPRTTLHDRRDRLHEHLRRAGLGEYFRES